MLRLQIRGERFDTAFNDDRRMLAAVVLLDELNRAIVHGVADTRGTCEKHESTCCDFGLGMCLDSNLLQFRDRTPPRITIRGR